jgi:hypothetical protein
MAIEIRLYRWVFMLDFGFTDLFLKLGGYELHIQKACGKFHWKPDFESTGSGFYGNWLKLDFAGSSGVA